MSIQDNKVIITTKSGRAKAIVWLLGGVEIALTLILGLIIATTKMFSPSADSAAGVINKLSYQGRLTDTAGDPLGGTGTNYCFRFSIYDAVSSGAKVWPSGTPATSTLSVVEGVFNAEVGTADTLDFNFYPTSTTYLNVEVNTVATTCTGTWENLAPRQPILATGYAIAAENVYGDLVRTDVASSIVQIGTGAGVSSSTVKKLVLDWANTSNLIGESCTPSGALWYNSSASNTQTLVCDNGIVRSVGYSVERPKFIASTPTYSTIVAAMAATNITSLFIQSIYIPGPISLKTLGFMFDRSTGTTLAMTLNVGIYTLTGNTLSLISSTSNNYSLSTTAQWGGTPRLFHVTGLGALELTGGTYFIAMRPAITSGQVRLWGRSGALHSAVISAGTNSSSGNVSVAPGIGWGGILNSSVVPPASIALTAVRGSINTAMAPYLMITEIP